MLMPPILPSAFEIMPVSFLIIAWIASITYGIYRLFSSRQPGAGLRASLVTFGVTFITSLISTAVITVRASQRGGRSLCEDFSAAQSACAIGFSIVVLSWIATLICAAGFVMSYSAMSAIEVTPMRHNDKANRLDLIAAPKAKRPTTIDSFVQQVPRAVVRHDNRFWTMAVDQHNPPKDLFHQSLPRSCRRPEDLPVWNV
ncbi:hypothetical protein FIBSPDRAFT_410760 [Athelia psychrophila]|uniref:Uncharacterized protein n=1 Tax=Athelia psychrophila TaxID=1759441 RepID=A0A166NBH5_9AGAM|nr:hypothetical protein FIBSPDRAFT_410760 [Fibularhizoctonia sp. CBS 109695]